jgi:lipopolysaccharide export system protein LptC
MDHTREFFDRLIAWSPALLLGALAALTFWLDAQVQPPAARRDGSTRHDPDLFLVNFRAVNFDENGKPREALAAKRGDHFPDDESVDLTQPMFKVTQSGKPAFTVTADTGKISGDREHAYFTGNVVAHREAETAGTAGSHDPAGPMTLTTEYLHVIPKSEQAESDKPVTIKEPRGIIEAGGIELDNKNKTVKFKSRITSTLKPRSLSK